MNTNLFIYILGGFICGLSCSINFYRDRDDWVETNFEEIVYTTIVFVAGFIIWPIHLAITLSRINKI